MIALLPPVPATAGRAAVVRRHPWLLAPIGLLAGTVVGVVARVWMRWISTEPEFTWAGTIFIVTAFALLGLTHGVAAAARLGARRRAVVTAARLLAVVGMMTIFAGAGAIMLPTVLGGGLALYRTDWRRWARVVLAVVAALPALFVAKALFDDFGVLPAIPRIALFVAIYGAVIWATRASLAPLHDGWRMGRVGRVILVAGGLLLAGVLALAVVGA